MCIVCSSKVDFKNAASQNLGELCHVFQFKAKLGRGILNNSKAKHGPESRKVLIMPSLRKQTNVPLKLSFPDRLARMRSSVSKALDLLSQLVNFQTLLLLHPAAMSHHSPGRLPRPRPVLFFLPSPHQFSSRGRRISPPVVQLQRPDPLHRQDPADSQRSDQFPAPAFSPAPFLPCSALDRPE